MTNLLLTENGRAEVAGVKIQFREEEKGRRMLECMEEAIGKASN